jgi:hypothetical protein
VKVRLIKKLPGLSQHVKEGEELTATKCTHVKGCFNLFRDHVPVEWCVPAEYLEEIK